MQKDYGKENINYRCKWWFGKLTVLTSITKGHQVAASMRDIHGKNKNVADELRKAGAKIIEIDVTDDNTANNGAQKAITEILMV